MTLESSNTTVGILYDIENAPFEMLNYTLGKARRFQPCRTIVISDWEERPEQKRWEKLLRRPGFTFRQISRTFLGKNSLDSALYDSAKLLYEEGVRRYFIITTDSDFVRIAQMLNSKEKSYIIGVGTKQASETLRNAYDEFIVYPAEEKETVRKKHTRKNAETAEKAEEALEKAEPNPIASTAAAAMRGGTPRASVWGFRRLSRTLRVCSPIWRREAASGLRWWSWGDGSSRISRWVVVEWSWSVATMSVTSVVRSLSDASAARCASSTSGDSARWIAWSISSDLLSKTRKIVPSAMPHASAICRVLTARPWSTTSGRTASRMASRRSARGRGAALLTADDYR